MILSKQLPICIRKYSSILWARLPATLAVGFFIFYFLEGYAYTLLLDLQMCYDVVLGTDPNERMKNIVHYSGVFRHPYYFLSLYPFFWIIHFFTSDALGSIHIIQSVLAALSVLFLFKSCLFLSQSKKLSFALSLVYGFSLSQLIFASIPESFIVTGFFFNLITYLFLSTLKDKKVRTVLFAFLFALSFGVTILNAAILGIMFIFYLCARKMPAKKILFETFKCGVFSLLFIAFFISAFNGFDFKRIIRQYDPREGIHNPLLWLDVGGGYYRMDKDDKIIKRAKSSSDFSYNILRFHRFTLTSWNFGHELNRESKKSAFSETDGIMRPALSTIFFLTFFLLWIVGAVLVKRVGTRPEKTLFSGFSTLLILNFFLFMFWYPTDGFLYSQHHIFLWFIIMAMSFKTILLNARQKKYNVDDIARSLFVFFLFFAGLEFVMNHSLSKEIIVHAYEHYPLTKKTVVIDPKTKQATECFFSRPVMPSNLSDFPPVRCHTPEKP